MSPAHGQWHLGMKWLLVLLVVLGVLLMAAGGLRAFGARHWADLMRAHSGELEAQRANGHGQPMLPAPFDARELQGLPVPVARYFRTVFKDGQPIIAAARIDMRGSMNMSATAEQWKPFSSQQHVVTRRPGFLWDAQVRMVPGVPVRVEDSYIAGQGRLSAQLLGLFPVADVSGGGEIARGEFMRWFAEAPWYPTALLPSQGVRWAAVDETSAMATLVDGPLTVSLLFSFNAAGLIATVHAEARGAGSGQDMVMLPWDCSFSDYQWHEGLLLPMAGEAAYLRPTGRKTYFVGQVQALHHEFWP